MNVLFILNDAPNEAGRSLNALRLACPRSPPGSRADADETEALVKAVIQRGSDVRVCGTCAKEDEECQWDVCRGDLLAARLRAR
ncbi:MAG: hypothetical protein ACREV7_19100 [Steroidobacteraceae bacterium]